MPKEPSPFPEHADAAGETGPPAARPGKDTAPGIRRQAAEIIDTVLSGSGPEEAAARDQLRRRLAAHPGRPEAALAEHLAALRSHPGPAGPSRSRVETVLEGGMLLTAFQPICDLSSGAIIGAQALTRFVSDGGDEATEWFAEAREERLGSELEFAALEAALHAAQQLPPHIYVALKLSAATCLDPLLPGVLDEAALVPGRMVLELTEAMTREQPDALAAALAPLRRSGIRLAIDHAGSHFSSIRHISRLRPDIIKLDRNLVAGIDTDPLRSSLGEAMVGFARHIDAAVTAQGIETYAELAAVRALGVTSGQGYLLGRPTTSPKEWNGWTPATDQKQFRTTPGNLRT